MLYIGFNYNSKDIEGYKFSYVRYICVIIGCVLTAGLLRLLFHWFPHWMLWCTHKACGLKEADKVMIKVWVQLFSNTLWDLKDISGIYIHKVHYPTKEKSRLSLLWFILLLQIVSSEISKNNLYFFFNQGYSVIVQQRTLFLRTRTNTSISFTKS